MRRAGWMRRADRRSSCCSACRGSSARSSTRRSCRPSSYGCTCAWRPSRGSRSSGRGAPRARRPVRAHARRPARRSPGGARRVSAPPSDGSVTPCFCCSPRDPRLRRRLPRRHGGERRAARDPHRPRHDAGRAAVGRRGLPADARRAAARRRLARRPVRAPARVRAGVAGFGVTSLLCAVAPSAELLIGARALQGIAGALLVPSSLALITATFRGRRARRGDRLVDGVDGDRDGGRAARSAVRSCSSPRGAGSSRSTCRSCSRRWRSSRARRAGESRRGVRAPDRRARRRARRRSGSRGRCSR